MHSGLKMGKSAIKKAKMNDFWKKISPYRKRRSENGWQWKQRNRNEGAILGWSKNGGAISGWSENGQRKNGGAISTILHSNFFQKMLILAFKTNSASSVNCTFFQDFSPLWYDGLLIVWFRDGPLNISLKIHN